MCQYWKNFIARIKQLPDFLQWSEDIKVKAGIGLFHVHGHVKECFARYAPTFIVGAGMLDGEVVETLWNPLNHTASSARAMSWHHRQEYLDAHMGDSNWLKLTKMSTFRVAVFHRALTHCNSTHTVQKMEHCRTAGQNIGTGFPRYLRKRRRGEYQIMDCLRSKAPG